MAHVLLTQTSEAVYVAVLEKISTLVNEFKIANVTLPINRELKNAIGLTFPEAEVNESLNSFSQVRK